MNMVPPSTSTHAQSGPSSLMPAQPLPRPPNAPVPNSSSMSHPSQVNTGHPMSGHYGHMPHHHHHQQPSQLINNNSNGPPSYSSMPNSSPSTRSLSNPNSGPPSAMHPSHPSHTQHQQHPSQPFHHPLHSPSGMRQTSHHPPPMHNHHMSHPMHPPQSHHPNMPQQHPQHHQGYPQHAQHSSHSSHPGPGPSQHSQHSQHGQHSQHSQHGQHGHYPPPHNPGPRHGGHHGMPQSSGQSTGSGSGQRSSQPQMYLSNSINGNWQSDKDMDHRREMIQRIVQLLKQRDKNSSQEWLNKLPQMVKQLEVSLYRSAPSFEAYSDPSTLKHRLQLLAMEIAKKTHPHGADDAPPPPQSQPSHSNDNSSNGMPHSSHHSQHPPHHDNGRSSSSRPDSRVNGYSHNGGSNSGRSSSVHQGHGRPRNTPTDSRMSSSSMDRHHGQSSWSRGRSSGERDHERERERSRDGRERVSSMHSGQSNSSKVVNMSEINGMMGKGMGGQSSGKSSLSMNGPGSTGGSKASEQEREVRIRHKQQRLLLLHHSSKCNHENGKCPVTQHCADMKKLWVHMAKCEDNRCRVPHCYSSRAILSHYRKCKDPDCQACGPVRETVYKSRKLSSSSDNNPGIGGGGNDTRSMSMSGSNSISGGNSTGPMPPKSSSKSMPPIRSSYSRKAEKGYPAPPKTESSSPQNPNPQPQPRVDPKIKHKQQRLLLLRHASKCTAKPGECKKTPHCAEMKKLWAHISNCHDKNCTYPHCLSSRYVLMHYRKCKDVNCPACAPVRVTIRQGSQNGDDSINADSMSTSNPDSRRPQKRSRTDDLANFSQVDQSQVKCEPIDTKPTKPKPVPVAKPNNEELSYSIINNFSIEQIELHLQSLNQTYLLPQKTMKEKCLSVLKTLQEHDCFWVFAKAVDPVELGLPDYFDIIKKPMDLGTVQKKLETGQYHSIDDFNSDIRLTFENAVTYNEPGSVVNDMATNMKQSYEAKYEEMLESLRKEEEERKKNDRACALCGFEKLQFEPPVFFCSNMKCASKRIHRNRHFYVSGNNQYNYCTQCYNELDNEAPISLPDMTLKKQDLKKKKNDEVHEENWVQCDVCQRWIHQICGLFNSRQNKNDTSKYSCPKCLLDERKKGKPPGKANAPTAEELPRTKLSEWIENYVTPKVVAQFSVLAREKSEIEKIPYEEAHRIISGNGKITIRQVTSTDRKIEVREKMRKHYKNYPEEFPYRCKCLLVFQNIDGADVILFALYVYEHGKENPKPNQRTVYISYLDSVYYMRPRKLRTFVYHEILIAYLEYAKRSGFAKAHIWACPPLKGDDYIFYAKPEDQKTPKDKMLTKWYIDMLTECQKRGIVGKVTNMYDLYFLPGTYDATSVPYLEGDYFSSEIESIIKDLEEGKGGKSGSNGKKKNKKKDGDKSKSKNVRKGTRSGGLEEPTLDLADGNAASSGIIRDPVMVKLGERIKEMKQSFIVAYLNWEGAKAEDREVPKQIMEEVEKRKLLGDGPDKVSKKRDVNGDIRVKRERANIVNDDTEEISAEIFDTRQDFLNLCKGNHYQFDTPRRAKHTSMMVLWHLHNKNAAKFVQSCMHCSREILSGVRYTCQTCTDVDLCSDCFKLPNVSRGLCTHQLVAKPVETEANKSGSGSNSNLTEAQRKERQKNITLHIKLLEHASLCTSANCGSSNCAKMKNYLKHSQICKEKMSGGCKICKRIWTLLRYHAQGCKNRNCTIPQCRAIRDRIRQIAKQQQAMDDRRRQMINRQYRSGNVSG